MAKNDARTQNAQKSPTKNTNPANTATKPAQNTKPSSGKQK